MTFLLFFSTNDRLLIFFPIFSSAEVTCTRKRKEKLGFPFAIPSFFRNFATYSKDYGYDCKGTNQRNNRTEE
jgi:hypothetical protein